jgi:hypothetical protein
MPRVSIKNLNLKRKELIYLMLIFTFLFFTVALLLSDMPAVNVTMQSSDLASSKPIPIAKLKKAMTPKLMLEGVFLSENESLAMINHQAYRIGDSVNDMKVISISMEQVTLQGNNRSQILRSSVTSFN